MPQGTAFGPIRFEFDLVSTFDRDCLGREHNLQNPLPRMQDKPNIARHEWHWQQKRLSRGITWSRATHERVTKFPAPAIPRDKDLNPSRIAAGPADISPPPIFVSQSKNRGVNPPCIWSIYALANKLLAIYTALTTSPLPVVPIVYLLR